ncbi:MAG TPA: malto-oligosyltrehalose trehalohydrolase [Cellvibrio sp.]|nr:malto-oligosyltrehalose trehalohydrolase [Cellvibrio sp.]
MIANRRYPIGAELCSGGAHFRVWAPKAKEINLVLHTGTDAAPQRLSAEGNGYSSCFVPNLAPGALYQFQLDNDEALYPDPGSRFQPRGPHGPSQLEDSAHFVWTDSDWRGLENINPVIYELHIGTFTQEGTYRAATDQLIELAELGITVIELMPINEFDGKFGWGYDGVALYAPYHGYGSADDLRHFIDRAHALGIAVILDVVYNHIGASGCYLHKFSDDYFSRRYKSEWGDVFNFDEENSAPVREFIIGNAIYWIRDFHFDGFRLDATQQIFDASAEHIIAAIASAARVAAGDKKLFIIGENEPQECKLVTPIEQQGYGLDALWNDDFHHVARVAMTGKTGAYFTDYKGEPQEFVASLKYGFLFQGQWYRWQKKQRGSAALHLPPQTFVHYLQSHDQVANGGLGKRIHQLANPALLRALTGLLLLGPQTPMLFQGQEFGASAPFLYFADNNKDLVDLVAKGRNEFLHQFLPLATPAMQAYLPRPDDVASFKRCKLNLDERNTNAELYQLHKDLLQLRKGDPVLSGRDHTHIDGAVLSPSVFVMRFFSATSNNDRLLIINLGRDFALSPAPDPLLAPHPKCDWKLHWSSELPHYGGHGACEISTQDDWLMPGLSAMLLIPVTATTDDGCEGD